MLILLFLIRIAPLLAQEVPAAIKELKVGDKCPDFIFKEILNSNKTSGRLSDYKGKLVIIDFFATWCGPCIQALPKMDSLQQTFGNKIAILPVTSEGSDKVVKLFDAKQTYKNLKLPFIVSNSELEKYFPHRTIPHEIWIDQNGIVKSITSDIEVNAKNIQTALYEKNLSVTQKYEIRGSDFSKPFLAGGIGRDYVMDAKTIEYSVLMTGYIPGSTIQPMVNVGGGRTKEVGFAKMAIVNSSIDLIYKFAFVYLHPISNMLDNPDIRFWQHSSVLWEAKDTSLYWNYGKNGSFHLKNQTADPDKNFSFEIITTEKDSNQIAKFALRELNNYFGRKFGLEAIKEKRTVKCWTLRKFDSNKSIQSKGGKEDISMDQINYRNIKMTNGSINKFLLYYAGFFQPLLKMPIIDETGLKDKIDIDLQSDIDMRNFDAVNSSLRKYGLEFIIAKKEIDMIVIRDNKLK